jgi:hypothetical protein
MATVMTDSSASPSRRRQEEKPQMHHRLATETGRSIVPGTFE